jgi:hypothetical protein
VLLLQAALQQQHQLQHLAAPQQHLAGWAEAARVLAVQQQLLLLLPLLLLLLWASGQGW